MFYFNWDSSGKLKIIDDTGCLKNLQVLSHENNFGIDKFLVKRKLFLKNNWQIKQLPYVFVFFKQ